ncbi:hypothetical protein ACWF0M_13805 [Kribbella sp. NPDC055110]
MADLDARTEAFHTASGGLADVTDDFSTKMREAGQNSASPAAGGGTAESTAFMKVERAARDKLVQYMSNTADGLQGYQSAITEIGGALDRNADVTTQRLNKLLKPQDGNVTPNKDFDPGHAIVYQLDHPRPNPAPAGGH